MTVKRPDTYNKESSKGLLHNEVPYNESYQSSQNTDDTYYAAQHTAGAQSLKSLGLMTRLRMMYVRNRLGELLVQSGALTPAELRHALTMQQAQQKPLGLVLLEQKFISRRTLYRVLAQQYSVRAIAATMTLAVTISSFGIKPARASMIRDLPTQVLSMVDQRASNITPIAHYPSLFGSDEKRSHNLAPFTKWTSMFDRFEQTMQSGKGQVVMASWTEELNTLSGQPLEVMAERVNRMVNQVRYVEDMQNWGKSDYWATPVEFLTRGGDCEDFAIAKYTALRALGVPEERLRIAIVHDKKKDIPHAVLVVYTDRGALLLDNQNQNVLNAQTYNRYRPIFSINRQAWWLHNENGNARMASAY
jgi:predicted transglutaminase-like cysteine proteinase